MKKGLLLHTPSGWCIATKKSNSQVVSLPVSSELANTTKLKHNTQVVFETNDSNTVVDIKKYTPIKSYNKNSLTAKPGGSTLKFIFTDKIQTQEKVKYPMAYIKKVLKEIESEPVFLIEVYQDNQLIWEAGDFTN